MRDAVRTLAPLKPANPGNDGRDEARPPIMPFFHMWTGPDGTSRLERCSMTGFALESIGGGAAPQWMRDCPGELEAVKFLLRVRPEWVQKPAARRALEITSGWVAMFASATLQLAEGCCPPSHDFVSKRH